MNVIKKNMQTLYRKYRPQSFNEVFGQDPIVKVLKRQVIDNKVGHAYLFCGPRGTGKTSLARLLAKAVNCLSIKDGDPCRNCSSCKSIEQGRFLDLIEIDAASNRGIDEIRQLKERVGFSPSEGKKKVYIIDEVHMLTKDAFNALLKTLEEPPSHVIFILATTEPNKVLPTIISRCQRFNFILADDDTILKRLKYICKNEKVDFTNEALLAIVKNANGSFRDAESILEKVLGAVGVVHDNKIDLEDVRDILGLAEQGEIEKFVKKLLKKDAKSALKIFNKIAASVNLFQFIRQALEFSRDLLMEKILSGRDDFSLSNLVKVITELSEAESKLRFSQIQRLPIEVAIVKICNSCESKIQTSKEAKNTGNISKVADAFTKIPEKIKSSISIKDKIGDKKSFKCSVEDIQCKWDKVVEKIRPFNHHLSAFFKKAHPFEIKNDTLFLRVPFKFHKQRIESRKGQEVFQNISYELFGVKLKCYCEVKSEEEKGDEVKNESFNAKSGDIVFEVLGDMID